MATFEVMDVREVRDASKIEKSKKFSAMEVDVVRSRELGQTDATVFTTVTHLGRHLKCGDCVLGYDIGNW